MQLLDVVFETARQVILNAGLWCAVFRNSVDFH